MFHKDIEGMERLVSEQCLKQQLKMREWSPAWIHLKCLHSSLLSVEQNDAISRIKRCWGEPARQDQEVQHQRLNPAQTQNRGISKRSAYLLIIRHHGKRSGSLRPSHGFFGVHPRWWKIDSLFKTESQIVLQSYKQQGLWIKRWSWLLLAFLPACVSHKQQFIWK